MRFGLFVGRVEVGLPALAQPRTRGLEHEPHAGIQRPQREELLGRHDAGVRVRKQSLGE